MPTPYLDFEIEIGQGDGRVYPVAVRSPAGEARAHLTWPFDELQVKLWLSELQNALLRSGGPRRRGLTAHEQKVQDFGQKLFEFILPAEARSLYRTSLSRAKTEGGGLRLKLCILDPGLAVLPWEFLFDKVNNEYLCLSTQTPLVRYLELAQAPQVLAVAPPLRILGLIASPAGLDKLNVALEKQRVEEALADLVAEGLIELHWLPGQTRRDLQRAMRQGPWHIFHYIGHGGFDPVHQEGLLFLADSAGQAEALSATQLSRLLGDHASLRTVFLNACEGAASSQTDLFSGTAATLMRRGIPAVVAMQYTISDRAAIEFTTTFYESLADGYPVDTAVTEARKAISLVINHSVEWGTPVLHMRSPDGVIFDLAEATIHTPTIVPAQVRTPPPKPEPPKPQFPIDFDWVQIPAGEFKMGSEDTDGYDHERPQHSIHLPDFLIARVPVTNAQFRTFVEATDYRTADEKTGSAYAWTGSKWEDMKGADWRHPNGPDSHIRDKADHPVVSISWHDAQAFCKWAGVLLPTEAQWEKAARGPNGRLWPWGNDKPTKDHCNFDMNVKDTTPIGSFPKGASPYGCLDMAGNVWEWTSSHFKPYPYDGADGREDLTAPDSVARVLRGGSFAHFGVDVRCAYRLRGVPDYRFRFGGFRVLAPGF